MIEYTPDPKGLYNKYQVLNQDGSPVDGPTFTLRPHDPHARQALLAYARSVSKENRTLANDLCRLVGNNTGVEWDELPYCHCRDEYEALIELGDEMNYESELCAQDALIERYEALRRAPIQVHDAAGHVVAVVVNEYDPGTPDVMYMPNGDPGYPGEPGHDYWRFASIEEANEILEPG